MATPTGEPAFVKVSNPLIVLSLALLVPAAAGAATVDPSTIASGTYTVKVVKVIDAKHIEVILQNGTDTTLAAGRPNVSFSSVQANDQLKLSIVNGTVAVFLDLTSH
jgi:hypothetical protein